MSTLLLHKNRFLRAFALLGVIVLAISLRSSDPLAAGDVTSIRLRIDPRCGQNTDYVLKIGATTILTGNTGNGGCSCNGVGLVDVSTTDPNALALVGVPGCTAFSLQSVQAGAYLTWARVDVVRGSGPEARCLVDNSGSNSCASADVNSCGYQYYGSPTTWTASPLDTDSDGQNNCTDPDIDGDGVANGSDNCMVLSNVNQSDYDNNGRGDACDPPDVDNDGILGNVDNCPSTPNANQTDSDGNGTGDACQPLVVAVPWAGSESKPHVVYSGGSLVLQAVATLGATGEKVTLASASWNAGDGSGAQAIPFSNSRVLELAHTYTGAVGTPYTATITVTDATGHVYTDTFKVQIQADSLDTRVNMAIDRGLWYNHKNITLSGTGANTLANCNDNNAVACTSGMMQAFEVNGHRESGDFTKDPYVDNVARGLRYLQSHIRRVSIGNQTYGNPDTNGNGYGLETDGGSVVYVGGEIVDAFVASGTKTKVVTHGPEAGRTYLDVVQDLMDAYNWGQYEGNGRGGWIYDWNQNGGIDSSSSGWWGVGAVAAEVWGIHAPQFVKDENFIQGIPQLQVFNGTNTGADGACSYRNPAGEGNTAETAACAIMMNADGVARSNARFTATENYLRRSWPGDAYTNIYAMYGVTKAMRLAKDTSNNPAPITMLGGTKDWYGDLTDGYATKLVQSQNASGQLAPYGGEVSGTFSNSWGILILSPALFEQAPTAVCSVDATTVCQAGAPGGCNTTGTNPYATVHFDGSQSTAGDNPIAANGYSWNFDDGGTTADANGVTASTAYSTVGTKNATLTVTDTKGNSSSVTCPVAVTSTALPPIVDAGGPYTMCIGTNSLTLDASASVGRGSNIVSYEWDFKGATDFAVIDATGVTSDQTAYFQTLAPATYDVGLRIKDDNQPVNTEIAYTTVTVRDCAPPVITVPANISMVTPNASMIVNYTVSATDNVDATVAVTCTPASGSSFAVGTTTVTCNAADRAGNQADTKTFTVTVSNNTPPTIQVPANIILEATSPAGAAATFAATANDAQDGAIVPTCTPASGSTFGINVNTSRTTTVNCSVTDSGGLSASGSFTVTVQDTTAPTVTVPANITVHAANAGGANVTFATSASDIVDVNDPVTCSKNSGSNFPIGTTNVTCSSTDKHNNTSAPKSFTVTVANTKPTNTDYAVNTHGESVVVNVLANAADADLDTVNLQGFCGIAPGIPAHGFCQPGPTAGTIRYTPNGNWHGPTDQFGFTINDGRGGTAFNLVIVTYVNQLPVPGHPAFTTTVNTPLALTEAQFLVGSTDADGDDMYLPNAPTPQHGTIATTGDDAGTYTPNPGFIGVDTLTFVVEDNHGGSVTSTATITVTAPTTTTISAPAIVYGANGVITVTVGSDASSSPTGSLSLSIAGGPAQTQQLVNGSATFTMATPAAGDYALSASYTGQDFFLDSAGTGTLHVAKAPSTTTVTCTDTVYTGAPQETCSAKATGVNLDQTLSVSYVNNTNVGTATGSASYAGDANHDGSDGSAPFQITPAPTTIVVTCATAIYTGSPLETCTASVSGAGDFSQALSVSYANNTNVGTATGSASYAGDANHSATTGAATFAITPAPTTTVVTCPASVVYSGAAQTPCTANVTGANLTQGLTVSYTDNVNVGTAGASASYAGDANHDGSSNATTFAITQAPTATSINAPTIMVAANGTVTVTVGSTSGTVLGSVSLTVDGTTTLTGTLSGGSATFTLPSPNAGDHALTANYAAQGNFAASTATGNLHVNPAPTATTLAVSAAPQLSGTAVTFTATVVATAPGTGTPNGVVTFKEGATILGTGTLDAAGVATFSTTTLSNGPHTIVAVYNGVNNYLTSTSNTVSKLIYSFATGGGTFVISDTNATMGNAVNFWGAQWEKTNVPSGGKSNASFKGFAVTPAVPTVGATFTAAPGNSAPSPASVPQYLGIIVTSKVTKSGSNITGTIVKLVIVKVDPGYAGDPGHAGNGTIIYFIQ